MTAEAIESTARPRSPATWRARVDLLGAVAAFATVAVASAFLVPRLYAWGHAMDEGAVLAYADLVRGGAVPHRDFLTFYGPGNLWFVAGAFELFGASVETERTVGFAYRIAIVLALFALARRVGGNGSALLAGVVAAAIMAEELVWAYATYGAIAFGLLGLALVARGVAAPARGRANLCLLAAGAVTGCAVLMRLDYAPAIILSCVPLLAVTGWSRRIWYAGGVVGVGGLYVPHLLVVGPAKAERVLGDFFASASGRTLPLPALSTYAGKLLIAATVGTTLLLVAGVLIARRERSPDIAGRLLISAAIFNIGLLPWALSRPDELHLGPVAIVPLSLLFATGVRFLRLLEVGSAARVLSAAAGSLVIAAVILANANFARPYHPSVENAGRSFSAYPDRTKSVSTVVRRLERDSRAGESLFVGPLDLRRTNYGPTYIYFLLPKLEPASYYMEMNPQTANHDDSGLAGDLRSADWLVLTSEWDGWNEPNDSKILGPTEPNDVVRDLFCVHLEAGYYRLYERCDRGGAA